MSDKQKGSSSSTKDVQLNSNPNEVRSFEELEHCLEEYGRCEDCQQPNTGIKWCKSCNAERFKNAEPNNRVSAKELTDILTQYYKDVHVKNKEAKIYQQIEAIEKSTESSGYKPNKSTRLKSKQLELVIPDSNDYTFEDEDN
ncbi:485_t:CDS:2 [Entrophospora sp. SA101]|nr:485_t:CDS:2 [Entrophospora sp. SA101]